MTTAADTFAAFLHTLAETLDQGSEERAQRLHLSRFHLDRVVSATGGEPPERMRRRLLLERAAYRLVTSDAHMLERAGRLTDEQLDAPIEVPIGTIDDDMTIRSVLGRLVGQLAQWNAAVSQRSYDWDQERGKSLGTLRRELSEEGPAFLAQVRATVERSGSTTPSST
jgi:AraC-like DNA-binding protein